MRDTKIKGAFLLHLSICQHISSPESNARRKWNHNKCALQCNVFVCTPMECYSFAALLHHTTKHQLLMSDRVLRESLKYSFRKMHQRLRKAQIMLHRLRLHFTLCYTSNTNSVFDRSLMKNNQNTWSDDTHHIFACFCFAAHSLWLKLGRHALFVPKLLIDTNFLVVNYSELYVHRSHFNALS